MKIIIVFLIILSFVLFVLLSIALQSALGANSNYYSEMDKLNDMHIEDAMLIETGRRYNGEMCMMLNDDEYKELETYMKQFEFKRT